LVLAVALTVSVDRAEAADRIVLRNLDVVTGKTVVGFDEDGVRMDDVTRLTWDEIERGRIDPDRQAEFDRMLEELGTPLYRIRQRLGVGDYRGLLEPASQLYPRFAGRRSPTAYMVTQSLMWARLAVGRREQAVEPYLRCYTFLRAAAPAEQQLPGNRRLRVDAETGMSPELLPIWFDADSARIVLPGVLKAITEMPAPRPEGTRVYYGTLALAAGEDEKAVSVLRGIEGRNPSLAELRDIAAAQREVQAGNSGPAVAALAAKADRLSPGNKPLAFYWLGMAQLRSAEVSEQREGILQLLHLPAIYARQAPELAAAALFEAMTTFQGWQDREAYLALRRELVEQYSQTYHAAKALAAESSVETTRNTQ
jgi:hypothetical protein